MADLTCAVLAVSFIAFMALVGAIVLAFSLRSISRDSLERARLMDQVAASARDASRDYLAGMDRVHDMLLHDARMEREEVDRECSDDDDDDGGDEWRKGG